MKFLIFLLAATYSYGAYSCTVNVNVNGINPMKETSYAWVIQALNKKNYHAVNWNEESNYSFIVGDYFTVGHPDNCEYGTACSEFSFKAEYPYASVIMSQNKKKTHAGFAKNEIEKMITALPACPQFENNYADTCSMGLEISVEATNFYGMPIDLNINRNDIIFALYKKGYKPNAAHALAPADSAYFEIAGQVNVIERIPGHENNPFFDLDQAKYEWNLSQSFTKKSSPVATTIAIKDSKWTSFNEVSELISKAVVSEIGSLPICK